MGATISAKDIKDGDSFERWLSGLPVEVRREAASVIASRVSLFNVQYAGYIDNIEINNVNAAWTLIFWRNLIARIPNAWSSKLAQAADLAATDKASRFGEVGVVTKGWRIQVAGLAADGAAAAATDSNLAASISYASEVVRKAVGLSRVAKDAEAIERGVKPDELKMLSLKVNSFDKLNSHFARLEGALRKKELAAQGWPIWLDWYKPLLEGRPAFDLRDQKTAEALERSIAFGSRAEEFNRDFWEREPREFNADIAKWVAEARAEESGIGSASGLVPPTDVDFPSQDIEAITFGLIDEGQIDRLPVSPGQQLLTTSSQKNEYSALRKDAEKLAGFGQMLGKLRNEVSDLLVAAPADMDAASVFDLWRAINRLRRTHNAHLAVCNQFEPHEAKLDLAVGEELGMLIDTANNFAFGDPGLRKRDENRIAPQDRLAVEEERALAAPLVQIIVNAKGLLTENAAEVVAAEERSAVSAGSDAHGLQAQDQTNKTDRNLIAALLSALKGELHYSWKELRGGAYKAIGAAGATVVATETVGITSYHSAIWNFIHQHAAQLITYVQKAFANPTVEKILQSILNT
jgi:hypothetical protein